jgi:spermidine/putrescine-binding protein
MRRRDFIQLSAAAASLPLVGGIPTSWAQSKPETMALMTWGGLWGNGMAENVDAAFEKATGVRIVQDRGGSPVERVTKLRVNLDNQIFDLVQLHDGVVPIAEAQGVLEDLDPGSPNMPYLKDIPDRFRRPGWVAMIYSALGITYNPDLVQEPPTSYADLWNEEYRGRIVLPEITHSIGPYVIPIGALAAGKDLKDAETGFEMLREMAALEPIWARDTDTIQSSLLNEEAVIGLLYKSQTYTVIGNGGNVQWAFPAEGAISYTSGTGIAKNTPNKELAEQYINTTIDPDILTWVATTFNYAGTHPAMLGKLPPELQERVQFTDEEVDRIIDLDHDYMAQNRAEWTDRWNRIVAGG